MPLFDKVVRTLDKAKDTKENTKCSAMVYLEN